MEPETTPTNLASRSHLKSLMDAAKAMVLEESPDRLLERVATHSAEAVGADRSTVFVKVPHREKIYSVLAMGLSEPIEVSLDRGLAGLVARTGKPIIVKDVSVDGRFDSSIDSRTGYETRSILAVPIPGPRGRLKGVLEVLNKLEGEFTAEDQEVLAAFAAFAGAALDRNLKQKEAELSSRALRRSQRQLEVLYAFERGLADHDSLEDCMIPAIEVVREALDSEGASVLVPEGSDGSLRFRWVSGIPSARLTGVCLKPGEGVASQAFETGQSRLILRARDSKAFSPRFDDMLGRPTRDLIAVPLIAEGQTLGVLEAVNSLSGNFSSEEVMLAEMLASSLAQSLIRERRVDQSRREERLLSVGRMAASIVHDLRNPLSILRGNAEMLGMRESSEEDIVKLSSRMVRQVDRCTQLTRDLLDFCAGQQFLKVDSFELQEWLLRLKEDLEEDLSTSGINLELENSATGTLVADRQKLGRAFSNLASNSRAAVPRGGSVSIRCRAVGQELDFQVSDTGPGIPQEIAGRLFEPFVTLGKHDGTGLGLAIIRGVIEAHGGTIRLGDGPGAVFHIRLPREAKAARVKRGLSMPPPA